MDHGIEELHRPDGEKKCRCVGKHVPLPTLLHSHHIVPKYLGGSNDGFNLVWLCPTTHTNVHALIREYANHGGTPPGKIRKHYSEYVQQLAAQAWAGKKVMAVVREGEFVVNKEALRGIISGEFG